MFRTTGTGQNGLINNDLRATILKMHRIATRQPEDYVTTGSIRFSSGQGLTDFFSDRGQTFHISMPSLIQPADHNELSAITSPKRTFLSMLYDGKLDSFSAGYADFLAHLKTAGHTPTGYEEMVILHDRVRSQGGTYHVEFRAEIKTVQ